MDAFTTITALLLQYRSKLDDSQTNLELQEASLFFVICPQTDLLMYTPNGHLI